MTAPEIAAILERYKAGAIDLASATGELGGVPSKELGFALLDFQRQLRQGYPEVIYAESKSPEQLRAILSELLRSGAPVLATRVRPEHFEALNGLSPDIRYDPISRTISARSRMPSSVDSSHIAVVTAGTSDIPVAEEAAVTAEVFGNRVERIYDVGVAGIHRLFARLDAIRGARAIVAVAGMEGALASVIGGLVAVPVIAVPTSVGYGASFGGVAALLAMLNSCSAGVSVVNIDNGFGAGYIASMINSGPGDGTPR
jgi:pyridinium-3,5-biscarboxylic acid mononucleotide synthase